MSATFRISEDDYAAAMLLYGRLSPLGRWVLAALAAALLLAAIFGPHRLQGAALGGLVGGTLVLLLLRYVTLPMSARRHYRKYKAIQDEFSVELLDDALHIRAPHGESRLVWANVLKWRQDERFVLLYLMPRLFHVLPKSIASQGFDLPGLVERLNRHVGPQT